MGNHVEYMSRLLTSTYSKVKTVRKLHLRTIERTFHLAVAHLPMYLKRVLINDFLCSVTIRTSLSG